MPRTILLDANVIDQLNRGNLYVAKTLKTLLASEAKVYMSMQGYRELTDQPGKMIAGIGPDLPRTAAANEKMLRDLNIAVARKGAFGNRVAVYERNATGKALSAADQMVVAQAKAMNAEVWSFDRVFVKDPNNVAAFGVKVAPESQLPFDDQTKADYRVGRNVMNLKPTPITVMGETKPRGKPDVGLKGTASATPAAVTQSGLIETKTPKVSPPSAVIGSRSTEGAARGLAPKTWSPETQKRPSSTSQSYGPNASSARSTIKGKALDLKKIRESAVKALKPRLGAAKNLAKGIGKGLIFDFIFDYSIGKIIGALEAELDRVKQELISSQWANFVYPNIEKDVEIVISLEKSDADKITYHQAYIQIDWEVLLRRQGSDDSYLFTFDPDEIVGDIVWIYKNAYGEHGPVTVFEGVKYIKHDIVAYASHPQKRPKPKADKSDKKLLHEPHRDFILVWDKEVHHIAQMYRELARKSIDQLNRIDYEVIEGMKSFSSTRVEKTNEYFWINERQIKIAAALQAYNFREAKKQSNLLIQIVRGQFNNKARGYVTERTVEQIDVLQTIMAEASHKLYMLSKKHKQDQRDLLALFLQQSFENLHI